MFLAVRQLTVMQVPSCHVKLAVMPAPKEVGWLLRYDISWQSHQRAVMSVSSCHALISLHACQFAHD